MVAVRLSKDLLCEELADNGNAQWDGDVGPEEVGLGLDVGHDLGPLGHHRVTLALHLGGDGVQQDRIPGRDTWRTTGMLVVGKYRS